MVTIINDGIIPAGYIIFKRGNDIYARNGTTGVVDYSGSDAANVINNVIANLPSTGSKIFIREGTYETTLSTPTILYKKSFITIEGSGYNTVLKAGNGVNADVLSAERRNNQGVILRNFRIDGNKANNTSGRGLVFTGYYCSLDNIRIKDCVGNGFDAEVPVRVSESMVDNYITNIMTSHNGGTGFIWGTNIGGGGTDNYFINILSDYNDGDGIDFKTGPIYGWNINTYWNGGDGLIIRGAYSRLVVCVADANQKNGVILYKTGGYDTMIVGGRAINNSRSSAGAYHGFHFNGDGVNTTFRGTLIGCWATDMQGTKTQGWGVKLTNDTAASRNYVIGGDFSGNLDGSVEIPTATGFENVMRVVGCNSPLLINDVYSPTFTIDSTGTKTVTIPHGLDRIPAPRNCQLTVVENTAVDDWAYNLLKVVSTDATNVIAKINVSTASTTKGATAKLALRVGNP